jgi:chromosome segregation ATPase
MSTDDNSTQQRLQTAVDACNKDLAVCNVKTQESQAANEQKYSELQQKLNTKQNEYHQKDAEVEDLQKKLAAITTDNEAQLIQLTELHQELDHSQAQFLQAKQAAMAENAQYESELDALTSRMEERIAQIDTNASNGDQHQAVSVQQNLLAITEMQANFDVNVQQLQSKFVTTLDENTQMWQQKHNDIQRLLETKTTAWSLENNNVQSCSQLRTEATNTVKRQIAEISVMRTGLQKLTSERDAIRVQMLQMQQETQALKLQHQVDLQSHFAEMTSMKAKVTTLQQLAATNRDDGVTQLNLARAENDQLKSRLQELTDEMATMRASQVDVVREVQAAEQQCPTINCPQVEMTEYLARLQVLQAELESLRQEKQEMMPKVQALRDDLAQQKQQLTACYRKVGDSNCIEDSACQNELARCQAKVISMETNLNMMETK